MSSPSFPSGPDSNASGQRDPAVAPAILERADALLAGGDYAEALPLYRRLVGNRDANLHVAALLGLAESAYRLDDEEAAIETWKIATQAPETPMTWLAWKRLAAGQVRAGDLQAALHSYRQAERRAPADERAEIASRLGWLNKETGNTRAASRYFGRARAEGAVVPIVTYTIIALTVAIWLSAYVGSGDIWYQLFALDKGAVAEGELWRLLTVVLVHQPILPLHLGFNMYALYLVGPIVEGLYGRALFLGFYLLCAAAASVLSYVLVGGDAVGASGAIFGLFGLLAVVQRVHRPMLGRRARALTSQIGFLIAINLALGFGLAGAGVGIDNTAHIGGLLAGAWLGFILPPRGVATMGGMFQPGPAPAPANARLSPIALVVGRTAAIGLLVLVIAVGVAFGTERRNGRVTSRGEEASVHGRSTAAAPATPTSLSADDQVATAAEAVDDAVEVAAARAIALIGPSGRH